METIVKEFVKVDKENETIIKEHTTKIKNLQEKLGKCKNSIKTIIDNYKPLWSSEEAVVEKLRKEEKKLKKEIKGLEIDRNMKQLFRPIDLSFLRRRQEIKISQKILVPLFSVHKIKEDRIDSMRIALFYEPYSESEIRVIFNGKKYQDNSGNSYNLSKIFGDHFIQTISIKGQRYLWKQRNIYGHYITTITARGKRSREKEIRNWLTSDFAGLIPTEVKEKIAEAREITSEIYLIKEAEWDVKEIPITGDPLIICLSPTGKAYFVTSFDCTPVEYWAKQEYQE